MIAAGRFSEEYGPGIFVVVLLLLAALGVWLWLRRSRAAVLQWAQFNGFTLVECRRRWIRIGPFVSKIYTGVLVFRVVVRDREGRIGKAYVGFGGGFIEFLQALLDKSVNVRWDDEGWLRKLIATVRFMSGDDA